MNTHRLCPKCSKPLPSDSPEGLCPECLLKAALANSTNLGPTVISGLQAVTPVSSPVNSGVGSQIRYFGDYELLEEIARGGMGVVYKARQVNLKRVVALKMILAGQLAGDTEVKRFRAEAEAAAHLDHPHIVPIYEIGQHDRQHYFSMAFVDGRSLAHKLSEGVLSPHEAVGILLKVTKAIAYAHAEGVVHRDLKPGNILIDQDGEPRITDFGLAKHVEHDEQLTATGQVLGTPSFMPPEQAAGDAKRIGPSADIYALGAVLYCLLTGRPPFQAANPIETLLQVKTREPVSPRQLNAAVPRDLETVCLKCLEKEPARRYASAQELADELQRFLDGRPINARPIPVIARAWRWCRRNSTLAATITAAVCLVVISTSVYIVKLGAKNSQLTVAAHAEQFAKEKAEAERHRAESNEQQARHEQQRADANAIEAKAAAQQALTEKDRADTNAKQAEANAKQADANAAQARDEALNVRRNLYVAHMNQAQAAWEDADIRRMKHAIQSVEPLPGGVELRGWEWHYWSRLLATPRRLSVPGKDRVSLSGFTTSRDGERLIAVDWERIPAGWQWRVHTWADDGKLIDTKQSPVVGGTQNVLSPDGQRLATYYSVNFFNAPDVTFDLTIWDVAARQTIRTLPKAGNISQAVFDTEGRQLAYAVVEDPIGGAKIRISRLDTDDPAVELKGTARVKGSYGEHKVDGLFPHSGGIWRLVFSPDGSHLATCGGDRKTRVWDAASGELRQTPDGVAVGFFNGQIATIASDMVKFWDPKTGLQVRELGDCLHRVQCFALSRDGRLVATGEDRVIRLWDSATGKPLFTLKGCESRIDDLLFDATGRLFARDMLGAIHGWDTYRDPAVLSLKQGGFSGWQQYLRFDAENRTLTLLGTPRLETWDLATGESLRHSEPIGRNFQSNAISADGKRVARVDQAKRSVGVCNIESLEPLHTIETGHKDFIVAVALSPDGRQLATSSQDRVIKLWNLDGGEPTMFPGFSGSSQHLVFTPDGKRLIAAGQLSEIRVWDLATKAEHILPRPEQGHVTHLALSSDGALLAASPRTAEVTNIWNLTTCERVGEIRTGKAESVAFHPDGRRLATAHGNEGVRVWDLSTGQEVLSFPAESLDLNQVAFSPDGTKLAATDRSGAIKVWDATPLADDQRHEPIKAPPPTGIIKIIEQQKVIQRVPLNPAEDPGQE